MPSVDDIKPIARAAKAWAEAELERVQVEMTKLEVIIGREDKYTEMQDLITQVEVGDA